MSRTSRQSHPPVSSALRVSSVLRVSFVSSLAVLLAFVVASVNASAQVSARNIQPEDRLPLDPRLEELLDAFEKAQQETKTMVGGFTQVKEDELFAEAIEQRGRLRYAAPDRFRWDYEEPEVVTVIATPDTVQQWLPARKKLRVTDISKKRRRAFNYLGIGSDVENLRRHFDIELAEDDHAHEGADKVELRGKNRRIQKRMELLELWIDRESSLPRAVAATMADGSRTTWVFSGMAVNVPLDDDVFRLDLPEGAEVEAGRKTAPSVLDDVLDELEDDDESAARN